MARAWLYQKSSDKKKDGDAAPWYVAWIQTGKQRSKKVGSKSAAEKYQRRMEGQLTAFELGEPTKKSWKDYRTEFEETKYPRVRPGSAMQMRIALQHFERLIGKPPLRKIAKQNIDQYAAKRLAEKAKPPTINKELRTLRAFLREAHARKYLVEVPKIEFLKESGKLATYIDAATFAKLYERCDSATFPGEAGFTPGDWWRAYLVFLYLTGWRCMEPLSVKRSEFDAEKGVVILRAENNKAGRPELVPLHPLIIEHLEKLKTFSELLFPWPTGKRRLWDEFLLIQKAAGVARNDGHAFGFHDLRRAFATLNADRMTADALQAIMRHRDYGTTKRYISMARQLNPAVANLFVPDLKKGVEG